MGHSVNV